MSTYEDLDPIFSPRAVAVVGASSAAGPGNFFSALLDQGFKDVYPINPKADVIGGRKAYPTLLDVPGPIDHVISAVPAVVVPEMLEQAGEKGVRCIHFFTAGYAETGDPDRIEEQTRLLARARELGIRVIGPNCMGLYVPKSHLAWSARVSKTPGPIAFFSQSGANGTAMIYNGMPRGLRFSKVVSFGNGIDVNAAELFAYAREDPETDIVGAYLEGAADARAMFQALRALAAEKPVAILKGGLTATGSRATQSHTASLAGSARIWRAAAAQANAVLVANMEEMVDVLVAWRFGAVPKGRNLAIIAGGGGTSVQASDDVDQEGLALPTLTPATQEALREFTPVAGTSVRNPVDTTSVGNVEALGKTTEIVARDPQIDAVIVQVGMGWGIQGRQSDGGAVEKMVGMLVNAQAAERGKPLIVTVPMGRDTQTFESSRLTMRLAWRSGLPAYDSIRTAARALHHVMLWRERGGRMPENLPPFSDTQA